MLHFEKAREQNSKAQRQSGTGSISHPRTVLAQTWPTEAIEERKWLRSLVRSFAKSGTDTGRRAGVALSASRNWLYWLIPAVAIAALLMYLFARPAEQVVQQGVWPRVNDPA